MHGILTFANYKSLVYLTSTHKRILKEAKGIFSHKQLVTSSDPLAMTLKVTVFQMLLRRRLLYH